MIQMAPSDHAFIAAAAAGNLQLLERYLRPNPDKDPQRRAARIDASDERGCTALIVATQNGRHDAVTLLLDAGADIDVQDACGLTALAHAVLGDHYNCGASLVSYEIWCSCKCIISCRVGSFRRSAQHS